MEWELHTPIPFKICVKNNNMFDKKSTCMLHTLITNKFKERSHKMVFSYSLIGIITYF